MAKDNKQTKQYLIRFGEHEFTFKKPTTDQFAHYTNQARKNAVKAAQILCSDLIISEQAEQWNILVLDKMGYPMQVVGIIFEDIGLGEDTAQLINTF